MHDINSIASTAITLPSYAYNNCQHLYLMAALVDAALTAFRKASSHTYSVMGTRQTSFCVCIEPAPVAEGTGEAAAEGDAAPEATPPAEEAAEGEEDEGGPPKPDYSKNTLEYVVASSGQVSKSAHA